MYKNDKSMRLSNQNIIKTKTIKKNNKNINENYITKKNML